jgi:ATP diphosphatase
MSAIDRLLTIMSRLRDPLTGCPWDKQQTFTTIVPHTLEEAYEVADCIERGDLAGLRDELGDLLFQIVFYAQLAREQKRFEFQDVVTAICDKLERRHPHVFGDVVITTADEQTLHWEQLKARERQQQTTAEMASVLDGLTTALPALSVAHKLQKRAAQVGFDWPDHHGVMDKVREELDEVAADWNDAARRAAEIGDLLFACVNLARHAGVDAETVLRQANRKFEARFRGVEKLLQRAGTPIATANTEQMEAAWQQIKQTQHK